MKFPRKLRHKGKGPVLATLYKRPDHTYRVYWRTRLEGKPVSRTRDFLRLNKAKAFAEDKVKELARGEDKALTPGQIADAQVAFDRLREYYRQTGRKLTLRAVAADYCENMAKLDGQTMGEAVDGFLSTVDKVNRKPIAEAVNEFLASQEPLTQAKAGERPQVSPKYHYNRAICLRKFAGTFENTAVSELGRKHLDLFVGSLGKIKSRSHNGKPVGSAKSRNHYRACLRQLFGWCVRKDYLSRGHRLLEAEGLRPERANIAEVHFYTPAELRKLLEGSTGTLQALIAIGGLAGLRTAELLRLEWQDVWRVRGHIEVSAGKAKTRQRRLVKMNKALAAWLAPFRQFKHGQLWTQSENQFHEEIRELCETTKVDRKENGLRHSFCTYSLVKFGEIDAAQMAGNSPSIIHQHYKGLATKAEATRWFAVKPTKPKGSKIIHIPQEATA
jgi:integrase